VNWPAGLPTLTPCNAPRGNSGPTLPAFSPNLSDSKTRTGALPHLEYLLRLAFFASAPFAIVQLAALFPVRGALIDVAVALTIFAWGDQARRVAKRSRLLKWFFDEALAFEDYYSARHPRPFVYYLLYPLLFPYWLIQSDARREFFVFRGYTVGGLVILLASLGWQYFTRFAPELGWRDFLQVVWLSLLVETWLTLSLLMPIATTFVCYHRRGQRWRRDILLAVGLIASSAAIVGVLNRRDAVVSYAAMERVTLRTKADRNRAHRTLIAAVRAARKSLLTAREVEGDGKVLGQPLETAQAILGKYYKSDEVLAFDLWASPRKRPRAIVLYFEGRRDKRPIWVAVDGNGSEIRGPDSLPRGAFSAMRAASDGTEDLLEEWSDSLDFDNLPLP